MKTLKDILDGLKLTEDQNKLLSELLKDKAADGKDVTLELVVANNGEFVKADKHDKLNKDYETLRLDFEAKNKLYEGYEEIVRGKTEIEEQLKTLKANSAKEKIGLQKRYELEKLLIKDDLPQINGSYNAYITDEDLSKISAVTNENGDFLNKFTGISDAYNAIKGRNEALYARKKPETPPPAGQNPPPPPTKVTKDDILKLGYTGLLKLQSENPELYNSLFNK